MFVTFVISDISSQSNCLFLPKNSTFMLSLFADISYVFCKGYFCIPILKIFLDIIIVSIYCLKFLSSKNYSYRMKEALVKIVLASGAQIKVTIFLDSKSFFISASRWHFILKSILRGKCIFPISAKYRRGIL